MVAAHPDDEVLGCGSAVAMHARLGEHVAVCFLSMVSRPEIPGLPMKLNSNFGAKQRGLHPASSASMKSASATFQTAEWTDSSC